MAKIFLATNSIAGYRRSVTCMNQLQKSAAGSCMMLPFKLLHGGARMAPLVSSAITRPRCALQPWQAGGCERPSFRPDQKVSPQRQDILEICGHCLHAVKGLLGSPEVSAEQRPVNSVCTCDGLKIPKPTRLAFPCYRLHALQTSTAHFRTSLSHCMHCKQDCYQHTPWSVRTALAALMPLHHDCFTQQHSLVLSA